MPSSFDTLGQMRTQLNRVYSSIAWTNSALRLAATPGARIRLCALILLLPVKKRTPWLREYALHIRRGPGASRTRFWFRDRTELRALADIFVEGEYEHQLAEAPAVIVDLGANVGQAALYFRRRYPEARIVSVEPDPDTFALLQRNLGSDSRTLLRQAAITPYDGQFGLQRTLGQSWCTCVGEAVPHGAKIRGLTLETLLAEEGIAEVDLMKVDIEGLELEVLGSSAAMPRVQCVIGEFHDWMLSTPGPAALEIMRREGAFKSAEFVRPRIFMLTR